MPISQQGAAELSFLYHAPSPAQHGHSTYPHIPGDCRCEPLHSSHLHIQNRRGHRSLPGTYKGQCPHVCHHHHTAHTHCRASGHPQGMLGRETYVNDEAIGHTTLTRAAVTFSLPSRLPCIFQIPFLHNTSHPFSHLTATVLFRGSSRM